MAEDIGVLDDDRAGVAVDGVEQAAAVVARRAVGEIGQSDVQNIAREARHSLRHRDIVRVEPSGQHRPGAPGDPAGHADRLPAGGRAVVHRRIGDFASVEARHLRLELEQGLERPWAISGW
jgi:hypothetical protein